MVKVSVVIPVHNGEKYISKCVNGILKQTLKEIEVILVENFSKDNSLKICNELAQKDDRVRVFQSFDKGTSFARKRGVLESKGKYITFSDQDDRYINKSALENMYNEILNNGSQICEFGHYKEYNFLLKKKISKENKIYVGNDIFNIGLKGVLGVESKEFSTTVWNKIYKTNLVKESVLNLDKSLFFAEDEYLNYLCFSNNKLKKISTSEMCYYCWKTGVGFSSSNNSGLALLSDYDKIKPTIIQKLKELKMDNVLWIYNLETVYFCKSIVCSMINSNIKKEKILDAVDEILNSSAFNLASDYFKTYPDQSKIWDELSQLVTTTNENQFYKICSARIVSQKNNFIKNFIKKIVR